MDLTQLTLGEIQDRAMQLAQQGQEAASRRDNAADAEAFEALMPLLSEIARREESIDLPQVGLRVLPPFKP